MRRISSMALGLPATILPATIRAFDLEPEETTMTFEGWPRRASYAIGTGLAFLIVLGLGSLLFALVAVVTRLAVGADVT
jgi:hypothetical protein